MVSIEGMSQRIGRSVNDYDTAHDLRQALMKCSVSDNPRKKADWLLPVPDPEAEEQTVDKELQRLLILKSYLVLDAEKEEAFDKLTEEACRQFNVPTSLISLVDLGRQFAFSASGSPDDARESSREVAFCAHTILSKKGICVVSDTKKDDRFRENALVTGKPHLRFYAGVPLLSPEGYNLGTFCVEGPEPRPGGLTEEEKVKLKDFASKAMELMVRRRKQLQQRLDAPPFNEQLRRHAAVTTNLGGILYKFGECMTAMRLYQEGVQTLMYVEEEGNGLPPKERQDEMAELLALLSADTLPVESRLGLIKEVVSLYPNTSGTNHTSGAVAAENVCHTCTIDGIPGLFGSTSKLRGSGRRHLASLVFGEAFQVSLESNGQQEGSIELSPFIIPIEQCSKATLFNMGLIHYHWGSPDTAMQFFDLAASLSQELTPLAFDPVIMGCLNDMAQIHLQYGRPADSLELLADALTRGNAALVKMYGDDHPDDEPQDEIRSRRLRRKLARTVINMGRVHFFNSNFDAAMVTCGDALRLLHTNMDDMEVAAVWFNIGLLYHHQGNRSEALKFMDKFLERALILIGPSHLQYADGLYRKGVILFEMGNLYECMKPLNEALRLRTLHFGHFHGAVAESLCMIGKVLQEREEYDFALNALQEGLTLQKRLAEDGELSIDAAQTLLDIGRALHMQGRFEESLEVFLECAGLTRKFFGERHPFVARIDNIIGNLQLETGNIDESVKQFTDAMEIHIENEVPVEFDVVQDRLCRVKLPHHPVAAGA